MERKKVASATPPVSTEEEGKAKVTVYLPINLHSRFLERLGAVRAKQSPTITAWVQEYLRGDRELADPPATIPGDPTDAELRFLAEVLALVRRDAVARSGIDAMVKTSRKKQK